MSRPLCIYHGNCCDGFAAAWVVNRYYKGEVDFHAGVYQDPPPDVKGRDVIMVDFSYKRAVLEKMNAEAASILVIDHHKTAIEDILAADGAYPLAGRRHTLCGGLVYDLDKSGAMLAWDWFFPGRQPPQLLRHIEDRDLWRFALPGTREIQACIFSLPYEFATYDFLMSRPVEVLAAEGVAIERKHHKDVAELVKASVRSMKIDGYLVPVANLPYTLSSDAGHLMCKMTWGELLSGSAESNVNAVVPPPFAACYMDQPGGRVFSLRSLGGPADGFDVSEVAKRYGGGGHRHAAGFRVPLGWEGE